MDIGILENVLRLSRELESQLQLLTWRVLKKMPLAEMALDPFLRAGGADTLLQTARQARRSQDGRVSFTSARGK